MENKNIKIEYRTTESLIPYINNARTHSEEQINQVAASIKEFGFNNPILVDGDNGVIAGHCRISAAQRISMTKIPVIELSHLSPIQKKAFILADNRLAQNAGWDQALLAVELEDLYQNAVDLETLGFGDEELASLLGGENEKVGLTDEDEIPETPIDPTTKPGDLWLLGKHRLLCGDSTDINDVEKLMAGQKADMLLSDPPYNVDYEGKTKDKLKIKNDKKDDKNFRVFLSESFINVDANLKPGGVFYVWHADSEGYNFRGACKDAGWTVRQCLIWNKNAMVMGRQDYHWKHEPCLYGWKDGAGHLWATDRKQTTVLNFDRPNQNDLHPTMKPVKLFMYQIQNNTKGEDIIVDPFLGSGTAIIACEKTNRKCYGIELDPVYCDVIIKRWEDFTGEKAVLEE